MRKIESFLRIYCRSQWTSFWWRHKCSHV